MYASHFGLKQAPFSIAPDPRYLFMSERHREALAHLLYGVGGGGGFVLLTGEIGAGKTTVCRCFLEQIPRRCNVAYIFNPKLSTSELLQSICDEFRIPLPAGPQASLKAHVDALNEFLLKTHAVGQNNVLIIDEAQNLSTEVLEQLRLLTNLETNERKLLQIILIGQPELKQMLARPELEQLAQRVIARYHLDALSEGETAQYIQHRLETAGLKRGSLFDRKALARIHELTRGVPRRINLLCDRALLGAYAEGKARVDKVIVEKAAAEVFESLSAPDGADKPAARQSGERRAGPAPGNWSRWTWVLFGTGVSLSLAGAGLSAWLHWSAPGRLGSKAVANAPASSAASAKAPAASPSRPAPPLPPMVDAASLMKDAAADETLAWQDLAGRWQVELKAGDPCNQLFRARLVCFRNSGGLSQLTQLDRPALLNLQDARGLTRHAVLTRLTQDEAWLQLGSQQVRVPLSVLSTLWRGDFATLWLAPEGYRAKVQLGQTGPVVDWLAAQLARIDRQETSAPARFDRALQSRLQAFQLAQGLKPDGVAGATTFMQINRAVGVAEPRLLPTAEAPSATR
jgi:general secretion pathway protein A